MVWQSGRGVFYLNLLDDLHEAGMDSWLEDRHGMPPPRDTSPDTGLSRDRVVDRHVALLENDLALKRAYTADPRWMDLYGLPVGYADRSQASVVRGQRAAIKRWKVSSIGISVGDLAVIHGVDLAREADLFPAEALVPQPPPTP